jgi:hypothetical protein
MQNRVGDTIPSAEQLLEYLQAVKKVSEWLRTFGLSVSSDERRALLHARRNAEPMVQRVHDLAIQYGVSLPQASLQGMQSDLRLRGALHPITAELEIARTLAEDTMGVAESEMWEAFLLYYGILSTMAARIPDLENELRPVREFMAHGKRRGAGGAGPAPAGGGSSGA